MRKYSPGLALFDIVRAFGEVFGITEIAVGWWHSQHSTDRGIAAEVLRRAWQREPSEEDLLRHRERFLALLRERGQELGIRFIGIGADIARLRDAGAADVFQDYRERQAILEAMDGRITTEAAEGTE